MNLKPVLYNSYKNYKEFKSYNDIVALSLAISPLIARAFLQFSHKERICQISISFSLQKVLFFCSKTCGQTTVDLNEYGKDSLGELAHMVVIGQWQAKKKEEHV